MNLIPLGRILNRFSKDIGAVDEILPRTMIEAIQIFIVMIGILIQVLIINWWILFPAIILSVLYNEIRKIYILSAQTIKRLEGNGKASFFLLWENIKLYFNIFLILYLFN